MSENLDKNQDELELDAENQAVDNGIPFDEEESTIFSAPAEHNDKPPKKSNHNGSRILTVVLSCVAVIVVIGLTVWGRATIKNDKEKETLSDSGTTDTFVFEDIKVLEKDSSLFTDVTITNQNGEFKFIKQQITSTDEDGNQTVTDYWGVEGVDISKLSTSTMNAKIEAAASFTAYKQIDQKTDSDCGFDTPTLKISVSGNDMESYTVLVGSNSPDGLGTYFKLEGDDKIYLIQADNLADFDFALYDLADMTSIPATMFDTDTSDNKSDDGAYAYFDALTLSGKQFPETVTIKNNPDEGDSASLTPYIVTTPLERYADSENLSPIVNLFSDEIAVSGCYAFDITEQTLKEFGLDNPDIAVTLTIDGESKGYKFAKVDDEYLAVIYDGATMIRKVSVSSISFIDYEADDLYMRQMFMYSINEVSQLKFKNDEKDIVVDISYDEDDAGTKTYHISTDGKTLVTSTFQTFWANMVGVECNSFNCVETDMSAEGTLTFEFSDGTRSEIEFFAINDTQYQFSINDDPMGIIASSAYNKLINELVKNVEAE